MTGSIRIPHLPTLQGIAAGRLRASAMGNVDEGDALEDRVDIRFDGYCAPSREKSPTSAGFSS